MSDGDSRISMFNESYTGSEAPPWDIGRPQKTLIHLAEEGNIEGSVLDVGCGTGENALYLADRGHDVHGIDAASNAIEQARKKEQACDLNVSFDVLDALKLDTLNKKFDTVVDIGLFHMLYEYERPIYEEGLKTVLRPGGRYYMQCFSESEPGSVGPKRISKDEIFKIFDGDWKVNLIQEATTELDTGSGNAHAYLSSITRLD